jgi:acetyltransferase
MVPRLNLNAGLAHLQPLPGRLAFVTQSNAVLSSVLDWATHRRIGFSQAVCLGDMIDVDFGDMLDYLAADFSCRAILLYMEDIGQARKFMSAARAAARMKPVIVVRTGRFRQPQTPSKPGSDPALDRDAVYDAAFARAGILRVRDLKALFDSVATLSMIQPVNDNRLAILGNGGGIGVLAADALLEKEGRLAALSSATIARLKAALPPTGLGDNPVDIRPDAQTRRYVESLDILLNDPGVDAVLVQNAPSALADRHEIAESVAELDKQRMAKWKPANVVTCWTGDGVAMAVRQMFAERHIPSYETPEEAVRGFMQMFRYRRSQEILLETPPSIPSDFGPVNRHTMSALLKATHLTSEVPLPCLNL